MLFAARGLPQAATLRGLRLFSNTAASLKDYGVVVIGSGTGALSSASQISHLFKKQGSPVNIAIVDDAPMHNYQPGWTLVGAGMKTKSELSRPSDSVIIPELDHIKSKVVKIDPAANAVTTASGETLNYQHLVVASGIQLDYDKIKGAKEALDAGTEASGVASIYSYDYVDQVWPALQKVKSGTAIFTQPPGAIKCAGAPQKILYLAIDHWKKTGVRANIDAKFFTATPAVFAVPKYAEPLHQIMVDQGVDIGLKTTLVEVDHHTRTAKFAVDGQSEPRVEKYDFLHVVPPQSPVKYDAPADLFDAGGYISVDPNTLRHTVYDNIWSLGDGSSTPNSKTAAACIGQAPVLAHNLFRALSSGGKIIGLASYNGYASCPITTSYHKVLLAEFGYGGKPMETFKALVGIDQSKPHAFFMFLVKYLFPWVYFQFLLSGRWFGPTTFIPPKFVDAVQPSDKQ